MPRSAIVSTGISGSTTCVERRDGALAQLSRARLSSRGRHGRLGAVSSSIALPCRAGIGSLQVLQLGEHMAEMLGVSALPSVRSASSRREGAPRWPRARMRSSVASNLGRSVRRVDGDPGRDQRRARPRRSRKARRYRATARRALPRMRRWLSAVPSPSLIVHSPQWRR